LRNIALLLFNSQLSHEEWPDADFDLPDSAPITTPSDKDDETKNPCDARKKVEVLGTEQ